MQKDQNKIIITRDEDPELYNLVSKIEVVGFGEFKFLGEEVKEIQVREGRPHRIIVIEKSILLSKGN